LKLDVSKRYFDILNHIYHFKNIPVIDVSNALNKPLRQTRHIMYRLEELGLIQKVKGRRFSQRSWYIRYFITDKGIYIKNQIEELHKKGYGFSTLFLRKTGVKNGQ